MKRDNRKAYNELKKMGVPVFERIDRPETFLISAEEVNSYEWLDYHEGWRIPNWEFGVSDQITKVLDKHDLYCEWENPACVIIYSAY